MPRRSGCCRYPTRPTLRIEVADPQHAVVLYGSPADMGGEDSWERSIWQFVVPPEGSMVGASCRSTTATPMARTGRADAHVIQELTPAVAATFASAVEAAIEGDSEAGVSSGVSNMRQAGIRSISQNGSD
jgi:hypothetical protein